MFQILVAEDDKNTRRLMEAVLKEHGYHPILACDGLEALKEIKAGDPGATIVMCSAMGQEAMVMDSIKSGAKDFIVKPFKPERILSTIKKILG